jgi:hypothetical protein
MEDANAMPDHWTILLHVRACGDNANEILTTMSACFGNAI